MATFVIEHPVAAQKHAQDEHCDGLGVPALHQYPQPGGLLTVLEVGCSICQEGVTVMGGSHGSISLAHAAQIRSPSAQKSVNLYRLDYQQSENQPRPH